MKQLWIAFIACAISLAVVIQPGSATPAPPQSDDTKRTAEGNQDDKKADGSTDATISNDGSQEAGTQEAGTQEDPAPDPAADGQLLDELSLANPRATMVLFVRSMEQNNYRRAVDALDFSRLDPAPDEFRKVELAQQLKAVMDRMALVAPSEMPDDPDGPPYGFPPEESPPPIVIAKGEDNLWRFTAETLERISPLYAIYKDRPLVIEATEPAPAEATNGSEDPESTKGGTDTEEPARPVVQPSAVPEQLRSARRAMRALLTGLDERRYSEAVSTLAFPDDSTLGPYQRLALARELRAVIDRLALVDYVQISDDPLAPTFRFPPDASEQPIVIERGIDGSWQFSNATVSRIDELYSLYKNRPVLNKPEEERAWFQRELVLGNETWRVLALVGVIFLSLFIGQIMRMIFFRLSRRLVDKQKPVSSIWMRTLARTARPIALLFGLHLAMRFLVLDHQVEQITSALIHVLFSLIIGYVLFRLVDVVVELLRQFVSKSGSTLNDMLIPIVSATLRLSIIVLVGLEVLTALSDQPPSTVIAGLGAGGLAVGLAAQDTIKNFFGSVMIFADRPFELGDRIVIDGHDGPVESVGFRSTRIRTLDGHLVTIPNSELSIKTICNVGKRPYIRRVFDIRLPYGLEPDRVESALGVVRDILDNHEGMDPERPPRIYLNEFQDSALTIRAIYWFHPPDYWEFCAFGERVNLAILKAFGEAGLKFALPGQRLFVERSPDLEEPSA